MLVSDDFKNIAPRISLGERSRFRKLSRIHMDCKKTRSAERIAAPIALIEFEYDAPNPVQTSACTSRCRLI